MSYLNKLINKIVLSVDTGVSQVYPINTSSSENNSEKEITEISLDIHFDDYRLSIYNPVKVDIKATSFDILVGRIIKNVTETKDFAQFVFDNGIQMTVDLRDEAYRGPEAMALFGPNDFWVVWN